MSHFYHGLSHDIDCDMLLALFISYTVCQFTHASFCNSCCLRASSSVTTTPPPLLPAVFSVPLTRRLSGIADNSTSNGSVSSPVACSSCSVRVASVERVVCDDAAGTALITVATYMCNHPRGRHFRRHAQSMLWTVAYLPRRHLRSPRGT